jgi:phosphatidylserine decarboxylase
MPDDAAPNDSQGYISEVATRAMIFIENPTLGIVCLLPIGMAEVSSCEITVSPGDHVEKGGPVGRFHFGGSSHCLIFGPDVELDFDLHGQAAGLNANNIAVRDRIAVARS